jgi:hypothetical protein
LEKGVYIFDVIIDGAHAIQKVIVYWFQIIIVR